MQRLSLLLVLALASACGPQKIVGTADLTITGAVDQTFTGPLVTCGGRSQGGKLSSGAWLLQTDTMSFAVVDHGGVQMAVLKTTTPVDAQLQTSEGYTINAERTVVTIDTELKNMAGVTAKVKGTMTCPPLPN